MELQIRGVSKSYANGAKCKRAAADTQRDFIPSVTPLSKSVAAR